MWFNLNEQRVRLTPIENGQTMENKKINRIDTRFNSLRGRWKKRGGHRLNPPAYQAS